MRRTVWKGQWTRGCWSRCRQVVLSLRQQPVTEQLQFGPTGTVFRADPVIAQTLGARRVRGRHEEATLKLVLHKEFGREGHALLVDRGLCGHQKQLNTRSPPLSSSTPGKPCCTAQWPREARVSSIKLT